MNILEFLRNIFDSAFQSNIKDENELTPKELEKIKKERSKEKYKQLFDTALVRYQEERDRMKFVEEKASKFMTALIFVAGVGGFFAKSVIERYVPPERLLEISLLALGLLSFISILSTLFFLWKTLKHREYMRLPVDEDAYDFFLENELLTTYFSYAKKIGEFIEHNQKTINNKFKWFGWSYNAILVSMIFVSLFGANFLYLEWVGSKVKNKVVVEEHEEVKIMANDEKTGNEGDGEDTTSQSEGGDREEVPDEPNTDAEGPSGVLTYEDTNSQEHHKSSDDDNSSSEESQ